MRYLSSLSLALIVVTLVACSSTDIEATVEARLGQERAIEATVEARIKVKEAQASEPTVIPRVVRVAATPTVTPTPTSTSTPKPKPTATIDWSHQQKGFDYEMNGQPILAINEYTEFINLYPDEAQGYYWRGTAYRAIDQELAIQDFNQAILLDPNQVAAYINRGVVYRELKLYRRGIEDFDQAIQLEPNSAWGYHWRGKSYKDLGQRANSDADHQKACILDVRAC